MNAYQGASYYLTYLPPLDSTVLSRILTWTIAFLYRWVPYLRRKQIIREALGSSLNVQGRLSGWSTHDPKLRPISMKFHDVWRDPDCAMMKWYNSLSPISTTFHSIQHRRNIDRPFHHEFLQILLDDGHICILERMGNGPDTDAVRWTGCSSHDIIQCFSQDQYTSWFLTRTPSELITEVNLPRNFDLIDVLAICYTIKRHPQAKNYTLQRFNCYFLCCTVLSILARRTVSWEHQIQSLASWETMVYETLKDLAQYDSSNLSGNPLTQNSPVEPQNPQSWNDWLLSFLRNSEQDTMPSKTVSLSAFKTSDYSHEAIKYVTVGICSLLDPSNPASADFLLASLMAWLNATAHANLIEQISHCLWQERLWPTVLSAINYPVRRSAYSIEKGAAHGSKMMSALLGPVDETTFPWDQLDFSSIQKDIQSGFFRAFIKICWHHIEISRARYKIEVFEGGYPLWKRVGTYILGFIVMLLTYPAVVLFPNFILGVFVNPRWMILAFPPGVLVPQFQFVGLGIFPQRAEHTAERARDAFEWNLHLANGWVEEMAQILHGFLRSNPPNIPGALAFLNSVLPGHIWADCLLTCVGKTMGDCVLKRIESEEKISVRLGSRDAEQGPHSWTLAEFQQHLLERIRVHARRVDKYQIAEALVVESGMAKAMSDIWVSLPSGFGRMKVGTRGTRS
ncbi:hypothetical protein B0J17DRAFT_628133 [Rhizoctonia solani]|nr:hypothetical protein B0J17DRAFT_628133 [Rhizoctonia solani]